MKYTNGLLNFISQAKTPMHTVEAVKKILLGEGFLELSEKSVKEYSESGKYFVIRADSSIVAFKCTDKRESFMVAASHTDTPTFKLTSLSEKTGAYSTLPTEKYGGSILYSWLDRPLSVAGRVTVKDGKDLTVRLVDIDKDLLTIPSVSIHQNRGVNDGYKLNPAVDMLPLFSVFREGGLLSGLIAKTLSVSPSDIISEDLYLYNREEGRVFGANGELILSPRLDNLASVYTSLQGFLNSETKDGAVSVFAAFDNEEVGSSTAHGANSTLLISILTKLAGGEGRLLSMLPDSLMVSFDNAHAKHPNRPELSNPDAAPLLGGGVAVKYNSNHLYTTDAISDGIIRMIAERAGIALQSFATRADMPSGSTLGSILTTRVGIPSVDLGIPQLAMHSSAETCAAADIDSAVSLLTAFYSTKIQKENQKIILN